MENAEIENQETMLRQQESLRAVIESISRELELQPLLTNIVRYACELIGADNGTIGLIDEDRMCGRTEAVYQMPDSELGAQIVPGIGLAGRVLLTREAVVLERYGDVDQPTQPDLVANAVVGLPIFWHGKMTGFFGIGACPPRRFDDRSVEILSQFARHAAIAIENARRYEREQRRTERFALIARIGSIITANLRLDDLLQNTADAIHELLGYPNVAIALIDSEDPGFLVLRHFGGQYKVFMRGEYRLPISEGLMGASASERKTVLVNDVSSDPRHMPTPGATGINAELVVPILLGDRILGVLNVESEYSFAEEDSVSLRIVADQLAVAIENARLFKGKQQMAVLEERQRLARELHDSVTQLIFSMTLIAQTLGSAWQRDPAEGERRSQRLLELSQSALAEMRELLQELRPFAGSAAPGPAAGTLTISRVRRDGLPAALIAQGADASRDGRNVFVNTEGYQKMPIDIEESIFRITQEALSNVAKHSQARIVNVRLYSSVQETLLIISDDGIGLPTDNPVFSSSNRGGGMGLTIMRERAEAFGGTFVMTSTLGAGTRIEIVLPVIEQQGIRT